MPKFTADSISTQELLRLEVQYRDPKTIEEALILRGVEAQLLANSKERKQEDLESEIDELKAELRSAEDSAAAADEEIVELREVIKELEKKLEAK